METEEAHELIKNYLGVYRLFHPDSKETDVVRFYAQNLKILQ
jgi:hypothetical protein